MESIKGHPEHVETVFGEAIVARDESLVVLAGASGLGPPDLCWLQKTPKSALTGSSGEAKGYYHCCLGVDASSSAAVAAYFATLTSLVEPPSFLQGLFSTSEVRIERGFYCCYDPLSRLDVRCELCIPGGVVCGALDCEGNVHDVTPELWRNCVVASFVRAELYDAELVSYSTVPVARYPPLPTPADEARLLTAVIGLYEDGVLPEALEALTVDQSGGVAPEHADVVLHTLLHYFAKRQRWGTALEFFARLSATYPTAALYVSSVQRECGLYDDALATLHLAVDEVPDDPVLLAGLATECLYADQVDAALRFATRSARLRPLLRPAWLALARAHVRRGAAAAAAAAAAAGGLAGPGALAGGGGAAALVVLNLVPPPPVPGKEGAMLHVVVPPEPKSVTKPVVPAYDLDVVAVRQVLAEEAVVHAAGASASAPAPGPSSALSASAPSAASASAAAAVLLPGALLVPREPPDCGAAPDTAPLRITRAVMAAVYTVLQELVAVCGWDGFLRLRSSVFVMHADSDVLREQQREAEERERQLQLLHRQLSATLPPSPSWGPPPPQPQPALPPQPVVTSRRPPPEGVDFEAALDEAAMMGLADYPEHLEDDYDDPRVAAAREAHRRHLREIAERQARLEAAEGGAYADDEWDGSSSAGSGGGGGGGGGGPSSGGRSRRGRHSAVHRGRRTPGGGKLRSSQQRQQHAAAETDGDEEEEARAPRPVVALGLAAAAEAVAAPAELPLGGGVVDAGEVVRQEAAAEARAARQQAQRQQPREDGWSQGGTAAGTSEAAASTSTAPAPTAGKAAPVPAAAATGGWWGTLFGGGGGGGSAPQRREAGPLGEAVERRRQRGGSGAGRWVLAPASSSATGLASADGRPCGTALATSAAAAAAGQPLDPEGDDNEWWWEPAVAARSAPFRSGPGNAAGPGEAGFVPCSTLGSLAPSRSRRRWEGTARDGDAAAAAGGGASGAQSRGAVSACGGRVRCPATATAAAAAVAAATTAAAAASSSLGLVARLLVCRAKLLRARVGNTTADLSATAAAAAAGGGMCRGSNGAPRASRGQRRLMRRWWLRRPRASAALPYSPRVPLLAAPCRRDAAAGGVGCHAAGAAAATTALSRQVPQCGLGRRSARCLDRCGGGPGPVAESGGAAATAVGAEPSAFDGGNGAAAAAVATAGAQQQQHPPHRGAREDGDDGFPLVLQSADADRQMVLEGLDVIELGAKRLCARWLDELIVALWHDLQAFLDWKALDSELAEAGFRSHADIVAGLAPGPTPADYTRAAQAQAQTATGATQATPPPPPPPPSPPPLPSLPPLEWLRRGLLAERLHHEADALAAYRAAVSTPPQPLPPSGGAGGGWAGVGVLSALPGGGPGAFSMIAWQAIMRLAPASDPRDITWALRAVQTVMTWLETRGVAAAAGGSSSSSSSAAVAAAVPFTTGFLTSSSSAAAPLAAAVAAAAAAAGGAGTRGGPATAAAGGGGGKLAACPLPVVHCLHLVAAVLGESGVEATLAATPSGPAAAGTKAGVSGGGGGGGATTATATAVHPAAATVLRHAVRSAAARAGGAAGGGGGSAGGGSGGLYDTDGVSGPLAGAGLVSAIAVRTPPHLFNAAGVATGSSGGGGGSGFMGGSTGGGGADGRSV